MEVSPSVISLINNIDGLLPMGEVCRTMGIDVYSKEVINFLTYLSQNRILLSKDECVDQLKLSSSDIGRYDRQLNYFNSLFELSGFKAQERLQEAMVVIFGVGAIGSGIAIQLAMAGIRNFILIDKDLLSIDSVERHFYYSSKYLGYPKVECLNQFLISIDSQIRCRIFHEKIDFNSDITQFIKEATFVINTMDEPYIGFTSMKIGRECFKYNIPLYVGGGFDAHLMSTGELIIPNKTPCVDCYTSYFSESLQEWKPTYNIKAISNKNYEKGIFEVGGLASMSLFSVSYASIVILYYIATNGINISQGRGELLFDGLEINYLNILRNPNCKICGQKFNS